MQVSGKLAEKKRPILNDKDFYWTLQDEDDQYDGNLRIVCVIDGSSIKFDLRELIGSPPPSKKE